jgi:hypothetical protein
MQLLGADRLQDELTSLVNLLSIFSMRVPGMSKDLLATARKAVTQVPDPDKLLPRLEELRRTGFFR